MSKIIVETIYGKLKGKILTNIKGNTFFGFQGIPYAKPPVGELRFKAPQPPEKWAGIRDATKESQECYQRHMVFQKKVGSEDCLYLNVYTPDLPNGYKTLKSVMVWIHGGAFTAGSSKIDAYGPEFLVAEDVVVVTINYRVGVLGFLSFEDAELGVPGNAALKDMVLALKWVQQNILHFNGNPNNVTIFGGSAGAASCHLLMLSSKTKGLFHRVISQSGSALNHFAIAKSCAKELCECLGCTSQDPKQMLKFLQEVPVEKLHEGQEMLKDGLGPAARRPIGPVVEYENSEAFLTDHPLKIITENRYHKIPFLIGYNDREGIFFDIVEKRIKKSLLINDFETTIPYFFNLTKGSTKSKELAAEIKQFYYGNEPITEENKNIYYKLQTDITFFRGIYDSVKLHTKTSDSPVFMYRLSADTKLNFNKILMGLTAPGAAHVDEVGYLFKTFLTPKPADISTIESNIMKRILKMWTNFAKYGNPNPAEQDSLIGVKWEAAIENKMHFLDIGEELVAGIDPDGERMAFWNKIYEEYGIH